MAVTSPDNIWTPDSGDEYALTVDLAAMADTVQDALNLRGSLIVSDLDELNAVVSPSPGAVAVVLELGAIFRYSPAAVWVQVTEARFSGTAARDTAYAKAGGVYKASGARVYRTDMGWTEEYFPNASPAGWYPVAGRLPLASYRAGGFMHVPMVPTVCAAFTTLVTARGVTTANQGRVTVAEAGLYEVSAMVQLGTGGTAGAIADLRVNGTTSLAQSYANQNGQFDRNTLSVTAIQPLTTGDYVEVWLWATSALTTGDGPHNFTVKYIGPR